jgi:hypothetical protein
MCAELLVRYPNSNAVPPGDEGPPPSAPVPVFSDEEVVTFQIDCIYGGSQAACDQLTAAGYSPDDNYGLGNSYSQASDQSLAEACQAQDLLACAELASRYSANADDVVVAYSFVSALIRGLPLDGLAPENLIDQMTGIEVAVASIEQADVSFDAASGELQFSLAPTSGWLCTVAEGLVTTCTYFAD